MEHATLYHPREVALRLGIAGPTLRVWSNEFAGYLSHAAASADGTSHHHRRYTERDLYVLGQAQTLLQQRFSYEAVRRHMAVHNPFDALGGELTTELALLLEDVRVKAASLPRKQRAVANALVDGPERFAFASLGDLARQINLNEATIRAALRGLGFAGYDACSRMVRRAFLAHLGVEPPRVPRAGSTESLLNGTFLRQQENLELARRSLAEADLDGICEAILGAARIVVCSTSVSMGSLLARLLRSFGLSHELVDPSTPELAITLHDLRPADVLLCLSQQAFEGATLTALRVASRVGARRIVIADSPAGGARRYADFFVFAPSRGEPLAHSVLGQAAIIEALASLLALRQRPAVDRALRNVSELYAEQGWFSPALQRE